MANQIFKSVMLSEKCSVHRLQYHKVPSNKMFRLTTEIGLFVLVHLKKISAIHFPIDLDLN
jgi:hypothetical protein